MKTGNARRHLFHAKLLLLGEFVVIRGADALAVPFTRRSGRWQRFPAGDSNERQRDLPAFAAYLAQLKRAGTLMVDLDVSRFQADLAGGLFFDSDIPTGYGLGSSGALCAAVYEQYAVDPIRPGQVEALPELRRQLAQIESFFHGSSSGADPLICFLDRPVLLHGTGAIEPVTLPPPDPAWRLFLLDTGITRQTGPLVNHFLERCREPAFAGRVQSELLPHTRHAVEALLTGNWPALFEHWSAISRIQFEDFQRMIPTSFRALWETGLQGDDFRLKICGAGGGGFLLGYARDVAAVKKRLEREGLPVEEVEW